MTNAGLEFGNLEKAYPVEQCYKLVKQYSVFFHILLNIYILWGPISLYVAALVHVTSCFAFSLEI